MDLLHPGIERFLRTGEGRFEELALDLFADQFENNRPYQAYCRSQGLEPAQTKRWQDIPAVPVGAFKSNELATFLVGRSAAIFESSGTTVQTPSRHYLKTLSYYETALKTSFARWVLPDAASLPFYILTPPPGEAPRSSLSWMMDVVKRQWGAPGSEYVIHNGRLDEPRLTMFLSKAVVADMPVALLGTTLAFLSFFDFCSRSGKRFALPKNSRLMDTGGMKGQKRDVTRPEFIRLAGEILGIPEIQCINEYGMCEMSSQFYGRGASTRLEGPPWVRTLVIDPATGIEVPIGQTGLLKHFDLANVDSVMALQTEDLGRAEDGGFVLLGRAPQADLKGCSLAAEAFLK